MAELRCILKVQLDNEGPAASREENADPSGDQETRSMLSITPETAEATRRALAQWDDLEVRPTSTPGVFSVANHASGKAYRTSTTTCDCPHHVHRGVPCKHMARVSARIASQTHWATDEAAEKAAKALADRKALWG